jgi:hypothetical protein
MEFAEFYDKYFSEEKIIKMLGEDLSGESKIRQSLKSRLLSRQNQKTVGGKLFLQLSFSVVDILLMFALFSIKKHRAQKNTSTTIIP